LDIQARIKDFLSGQHYAVAGASRHRHKYGNKVVRCLLQNGRKVSPINPHTDRIEGLRAYPNLSQIPTPVHGVCIITPPQVTLQILQQAAELGIQRLWLQPGAENQEVLERLDRLGLSRIDSGPCLLVVMGYHENGMGE
jgi:predicted CoA-binding protein